MMNFGYHNDDFIDDINFLPTELDDYDLLNVEGFSDNFEIAEPDEEVTDFDENGDFLLEDIVEGYEIYNMA